MKPSPTRNKKERKDEEEKRKEKKEKKKEAKEEKGNGFALNASSPQKIARVNDSRVGMCMKKRQKEEAMPDDE